MGAINIFGAYILFLYTQLFFSNKWPNDLIENNFCLHISQQTKEFFCASYGLFIYINSNLDKVRIINLEQREYLIIQLQISLVSIFLTKAVKILCKYVMPLHLNCVFAVVSWTKNYIVLSPFLLHMDSLYI
jgi:hypothetical protein